MQDFCDKMARSDVLVYRGCLNGVIFERLVLEQKKSDSSWVNVKSTTDTFTCSTAILSATKVVSSGTYRAKAVITIKSGTSKTTLTKYSTTETK